MKVVCEKYIENENGEKFYEGDLVLMTREFGSLSAFVCNILHIDEKLNKITFKNEDGNITTRHLTFIKSIIKIDEVTAKALTKK